ncbi:MAG: RNA polymerase sigma factor [Evtepia sp.]|uniref:RNA polymerase sigma factor n=1 Tax=Evtepia sp. TaxID=2773933 RepID=UPI002A74B9EE|nr:RNA polymerase sigma factor [Evtepia sp.]MDY3014000.1 RNA polymerase sigma factor [Evtepia sp.]
MCKNYYRQPRGQPLDSIGEETLSVSPEDALSTQITVRMCLDRLSEEFREVIILYYYQDLRQTEIADVLGIGLPLVKYRLKKAKEQLEKMLRTEG